MYTEIRSSLPRPSSSSSWPFIIAIGFLVLLVIGLLIWLLVLSTRPRPTCPPVTSCPPQTTLPIYLYGFVPGPTAREISAASGVLTPSDSSLRISPLNQAGPQNQQWRLIAHGTNLLLQHVPSSRYVTGSSTLSLSDNSAQATNFILSGPFRNGRAYYLRSGNSYLTTNADLSVTLIQQSGPIPLNAEWIIALGPCTSTGASGC